MLGLSVEAASQVMTARWVRVLIQPCLADIIVFVFQKVGKNTAGSPQV